LTLKKATAYRNKEIYFMNFVFTNGMGNFISTGTMNWRAGHEKKKRALAGAASSSAEAGLQKVKANQEEGLAGFKPTTMRRA